MSGCARAGEHLVVEGFDESSARALAITPGRGSSTFTRWFNGHVAAILSELTRR